MKPVDFMFLVGGTILVGFLADEVFRRYYIPDAIFLIVLGMFLGHFTGLLPPNIFIEFAGFMASIAVAVILFDTGLHLDLVKTLKESGKAFAIGTVSYFVGAAFISLVAYLYLGWDLLSSIILGTMLGGTSAAVVATISEKLPISEKTKVILNLESTLTNAYALVFVLTLINFYYTGVIDLLEALHLIVASVSLSILLGLIAGITWLKVLKRAQARPYVQVLTLGVMFLLYAVVEYLKGVGAIATFVFGLVLGNASTVRRMFFIEESTSVSTLFKAFNDEISFFIRVFFFVYLGIIFVPPQSIDLYLAALLITVLALIARFVAVRFVKPSDEEIFIISFPRGLSEAVVASLLVSMGFPRAGDFLKLASLVILFTNISTAALTFYVLKFYKPKVADSSS